MLSSDFVDTQLTRLKGKHEIYKSLLGPNDERSMNVHLKAKVSFSYVSKALERIESGDYGICVDCEDFIPEERLKLVSGAIRCVQCQTLHESINTSWKNLGGRK